MVKKLKRFLGCLAGLALFASCSFSFVDNYSAGEIQDLSDSVTFRKLAEQGYMGGSLYYNPSNLSSSALVKGATVAVRIGYVERTEFSDTQASFADKPKEAQYINMYISDIDSDHISFTTKGYNFDGVLINDNSYTLSINSKIDINNDGVADLEYKAPARKRVGLEKAIYLNFLSSQTTNTTTMFAVLPEQYSRGVYPAGVIGINPNGRFIYSKYEDENGTRAAVTGLTKGDFVVDSISGKYQKVIKSTSSRNARAIEDGDLEDVCDTEVTVSYLFKADEFDVITTPEKLLNALPVSLASEYANCTSTIDKLNALVVSRNLIPAVVAVQKTAIPEEQLAEAIEQIPHLSIEELSSLNRMFLEETFPAECPRLIIDDSSLSEVLPLASLLIGVEEVETSASNAERAAVSLNEFNSKRATMEAEYKTFKEVWKFSLAVDKDETSTKKASTKEYEDGSIEVQNEVTTVSKIKVDNTSYIGIGVKGNFSNTWGNIDLTVGAAAYFQFSNDFSINGEFSTNLLNKNFKTTLGSFVIAGPIVFNITLDAGISIPLSVVYDGVYDPTVKMYAAGLYGGQFNIGCNYGVKWKKAWIIWYPTVYVDTYKNSKKYWDTIYFVGNDGTDNTTYFHSTTKITPTFTFDVGANISSLIGGDIIINPSIPVEVKLNYDYPILVGHLKLDAELKVDAKAYIGITIVSSFYGWKWDWNIFNYKTNIIDSDFLRKTIYIN